MGLRCLLAGIVLTVMGGNALADDSFDQSQQKITRSWEAGVDGVKIEWGEDGSFQKIYSKYYQPLAFSDSKGVRKALIIAEEKAKAAIIRFLGENVSSGRLVAEVQADLESSNRKISGGGSDIETRNINRRALESLIEVTTSYASGELQGVIVLEKGVDQKSGEVWAEVGISQNSISQAANVSKALANSKGALNDAEVEATSDDGVSVQRYEGEW